MTVSSRVALLLLFLGLILLCQAQPKKNEEEFLDWARENGAVFDEYLEWPVEFGRSGRGVRATRDIAPHTRFLTLPESLVLNVKNALKDNGVYGPVAKEVLMQSRPFDRMVAVLLVERALKHKSFWYPYLRILPERSYEHALIEWTEQELEELQNEELVEARDVMIYEQTISEATCKQILEEMNLLEMVLKADPEMNFEDLYRWAFFIVASRSFQLGDADEYNLVPVGDLMNHHPMSSVSWKVVDGRMQMTLLGTKTVQAGKEMYNHYGDLTNDKMILDYSFISEENFLDVVSVEMPLDAALLEDKRDVWDGSELELDHFTNMAHFMEFFRILSYDQDDILDKPWGFFQRPSSQEHELKAFQTCIQVIGSQVPGSTSLWEDLSLRDLIETDSSKERLRMALTYRIARKRIFVHYQEFCKEAIEVFIRCTPRFNTLVVKEWTPLGKYNRKLQQLSRSKIFPSSWT